MSYVHCAAVVLEWKQARNSKHYAGVNMLPGGKKAVRIC
jgi:hypothetical protein